MNSFGSQPAANPDGQKYGADQVKLKRDTPPPSITDGALSEAWELVKANPLETLLLSFVWLLFNGNSGCNVPSGGGGGGGGGGTEYQHGTETWEQGSQLGGSIFDSAASAIGSITGLEVALIGGIIAMVLMFATISLVLGTLVRGGTTIYWLRLVRGQPATLGHTTSVIRFFVPLFFTSLLMSLAIMSGMLLLIVPGIIVAMGLFFVTQVVVDKNVGYVEALKASWRMTDGYKFDLFAFAIICAFLNLAGILACCVGVVVSNAVVMGATVIVYDRVAEPGNAYLEPGEHAASEPPMTDAQW